MVDVYLHTCVTQLQLLTLAFPHDSLQLTPNRQGSSHYTEAWQLPPPAALQTGQESQERTHLAAGAYVGVFRPPGGPEAEMGFHMCVAVFPSGNGEGSRRAGTGSVLAEEYDRVVKGAAEAAERPGKTHNRDELVGGFDSFERLKREVCVFFWGGDDEQRIQTWVGHAKSCTCASAELRRVSELRSVCTGYCADLFSNLPRAALLYRDI